MISITGKFRIASCSEFSTVPIVAPTIYDPERMTKGAPAIVLALSVAVPLTVLADVRITEIMYDTDGTDAKREWIEVFNAGTEIADISKWKFTDKSNHTLNSPPKNGGSGSTTIAPGEYAILASDAATFSKEYPGIRSVIDTTMSLGNAAASISLINGTVTIDSASYTKAQGAAGDGDSLQLTGGTWIHAKPTPGSANATSPSVKAVAAPTAKKSAQTTQRSTKESTAAAAKDVAEEVSNDPLALVNATPTVDSLSQAAAAGTLGGSYWWLAAAALAIGTGAAASLISRTKKSEWDIEESE